MPPGSDMIQPFVPRTLLEKIDQILNENSASSGGRA